MKDPTTEVAPFQDCIQDIILFYTEQIERGIYEKFSKFALPIDVGWAPGDFGAGILIKAAKLAVRNAIQTFIRAPATTVYLCPRGKEAGEAAEREAGRTPEKDPVKGASNNTDEKDILLNFIALFNKESKDAEYAKTLVKTLFEAKAPEDNSRIFKGRDLKEPKDAHTYLDDYCEQWVKVGAGGGTIPTLETPEELKDLQLVVEKGIREKTYPLLANVRNFPVTLIGLRKFKGATTYVSDADVSYYATLLATEWRQPRRILSIDVGDSNMRINHWKEKREKGGYFTHMQKRPGSGYLRKCRQISKEYHETTNCDEFLLLVPLLRTDHFIAGMISYDAWKDTLTYAIEDSSANYARMVDGSADLPYAVELFAPEYALPEGSKFKLPEDYADKICGKEPEEDETLFNRAIKAIMTDSKRITNEYEKSGMRDLMFLFPPKSGSKVVCQIGLPNFVERSAETQYEEVEAGNAQKFGESFGCGMFTCARLRAALYGGAPGRMNEADLVEGPGNTFKNGIKYEDNERKAIAMDLALGALYYSITPDHALTDPFAEPDAVK